MTKKKNVGAFTRRALMALVPAMADKNYSNAEVIVTARAHEHGVKAGQKSR